MKTFKGFETLKARGLFRPAWWDAKKVIIRDYLGAKLHALLIFYNKFYKYTFQMKNKIKTKILTKIYCLVKILTTNIKDNIMVCPILFS